MIFTVDGKPQGKARPRFNSYSGTVYTPKNTLDYEQLIRYMFFVNGGKKFGADSFIKIIVTAYMSIPKRATKDFKSKCLKGIQKPVNKPDVDNILKVVMDALNGIAYDDDKQVVEAICKKEYSSGKPFIQVELMESVFKNEGE